TTTKPNGPPRARVIACPFSFDPPQPIAGTGFATHLVGMTPLKQRKSTRKTSADAHPPEIRVEAVRKSFADNAVLRGVDLLIRRGDMVAIVGASGSGKTVLLKHLIAHLQPDRGRVLVADHESPGAPLVDLASLDEEALDRLRRHLAVVFQKNAL